MTEYDVNLNLTLTVEADNKQEALNYIDEQIRTKMIKVEEFNIEVEQCNKEL